MIVKKDLEKEEKTIKPHSLEEEKTREEEPFYYEDEEDIPYPESWF